MVSFLCREVWHKICHVRLPVSIKKPASGRRRLFLFNGLSTVAIGHFWPKYDLTFAAI